MWLFCKFVFNDASACFHGGLCFRIIFGPRDSVNVTMSRSLDVSFTVPQLDFNENEQPRSFRNFFYIISPSMNLCSSISGVKLRNITRSKYFVLGTIHWTVPGRFNISSDPSVEMLTSRIDLHFFFFFISLQKIFL